MPLFLDTRHLPSVAIGICDRCRMKRSITELIEDADRPGLRVCTRDCADQRDPWRMAKRKPENIVVRHPRPDEPLIPLPEQ